ncbi:hypothetical protein BDQ17DRAFT_197892 [Cyathus striatus]|nr:hypothetical protein BDQ17DRAFT_197892 [Cyathus striatus]
MSNLALQGIVGIHAMSAIAELLGNKGDMEIYSRNASSKLSQWQDLAFQENHLITAYQTPTSWSVMYNLYSAKMLGLEVDQQILDSQSRFYELQATDASAFGFSYTSEAHLVRSYWLLIASATTTSPGARDIFIKQVHDRFFWNGTTDFPCPSTYNKDTGESNGFPGGRSGLTLGASFSHLALNIPDKIIISSTNSTTTTISPSQGPSRTDASKKTDVGA